MQNTPNIDLWALCMHTVLHKYIGTIRTYMCSNTQIRILTRRESGFCLGHKQLGLVVYHLSRYFH